MKPDDIPQDVWDEAENAMIGNSGDLDFDLSLTIASAILAERERCAKACEGQAQQFLSPEYAFLQPLGSLAERFACEQCAAAIRKGSPQLTPGKA